MKIKYDVPIKKLSPLPLDGIFSEVIYLESLKEVIEFLKEEKEYYFLGKGTNTLPIVSRVNTPLVIWKNSEILINEKQIIVSGNMAIGEAFQKARENNFSNFIGINTIPGTIGAAIKNNATFLNYSSFSNLQGVLVISNGKTKYLRADEIVKGYRKTNIEGIVLLAFYAPIKIDENYKNYIDYICNYRKKQPFKNTLGSIFKNGKMPAFKYIESLGEKYFENKCFISEKHFNFFEVEDECKPEDIYKLILRIQKDVYLQYNCLLELEIKLLK